MRSQYTLFNFGLLLLLACGLALMPQITSAKSIYGRAEYFLLFEAPTSNLEAKLDTGAYYSAIHAQKIHFFEKTGQKWVSFLINHGETNIELSRPLLRFVKVKKRLSEQYNGKNHENRPVVQLNVCIGQQIMAIETTLTNRANFKYPLLIGRKAMKQYGMVIDPSLIMSAKKPNCANTN